MIDALIVGAGPTGLTLACELLKRGLTVRLIELLKTPTNQSRALGIQPRTLEVFEKMGLIDRFLKMGRKIQGGNFYRNHKKFGRLDFAAYLDAPYPFLLSLPQADTEKILSTHFESLGGKIERGVALKSLEGSTAELDTGEKIAAKWIFGCDGAHSAVRRSLDLPFKGATFPETFALADVELSNPLPADEVQFFLHRSGVCGIIPLPQKNVFRIIAINPKDKLSEASTAFFQGFLNRTSGHTLTITKTIWMSLFTIHRRIAPKMRVGNTFLVGDAAHIHSPAGGQGLNTSVQDAYNLAWKIALVHQGLSRDDLLDSYEAERYPVAKSVLRTTTFMTFLMTSRLLQGLLSSLFSLFLGSKFFQRRFTRTMSELYISYPKSPILTEPKDPNWQGPRPGERAPDAILSTNKRLYEHFFHPQHTLLCFGDCGPLVSQIKARYAKVIRVVQLELGAAPAYHTDRPCIYLVRPDDVIAYRSRSLDLEKFKAYLALLFFADEVRG
ncbi:MAG: FAD-dependent monooxygenase [Candidatus Melainabacteria bacterium]|nr:FAD-dependent monooxygenase [Candidatus Melainabacteria bacterium]